MKDTLMILNALLLAPLSDLFAAELAFAGTFTDQFEITWRDDQLSSNSLGAEPGM